MFQLNYRLANLVRGCQRLVEPVNSNGSVWQSGGSRRAVSCSAAWRQTDGASSAETKDVFSYYPPLPGQDSVLLWDGKKFEELPIAHVKATYNNTHIQVTDSDGRSMARTSCGTEGFRNVKKSTSIAAQTTGISAAAKAQAKGVKFVRVLVKGLGPGRLPAIKGLSMGGLEVVSITDNTPVPHNGCRPRKARRV